MTFLAHDRLEHAFFRMGQVSALEDFLRERSAGDADLVTRIFLAKHLRKKGEMDEAGRTLKGILDQWPSSREARQELINVLLAQGRNEEALAEYEDLIASLHVADRHFLCQACGYKSAQLLWKCPQCRKWDTMASREEGVPHGGQEP